MADPLSVTASLLALVTFAAKSTQSLHQLISSFKSSQRTIRGLKEELEALNEVLQSLHATISNGKACQEFEAIVLKCTKHSSGTRRSLRDWTTLTYMGGDINAFKNMLGGYKSTIAIALGDANIRTTNVTISLLNEYNTMIANTTSDLKEHLQELDEKLQAISQGAQAFNVDNLEQQRIKEERESAQSCLDICIQVSAHIDDVQQNAFVNTAGTSANNQDSTAESKKFTLAEAVTNNTLTDCKLGLAQTTSQLREQLHRINEQMRSSSQLLTPSGEQAIEQERIREELRSVEQSLKICSEAAEKAVPDRIHVFEDVLMGDDGDQIIVATFGDLISAKRVTTGSRSRQFFGQMSDTSLQLLSQRISRGPLEVDVDKSPFVLLLTETVLGKDHPGTLASINNLAVALRLQGKYVNSHIVRAEDDNDIPINPTGPIQQIIDSASAASNIQINRAGVFDRALDSSLMTNFNPANLPGTVDIPGLSMAALSNHGFPSTYTPLSDYEPIVTPTYPFDTSVSTPNMQYVPPISAVSPHNSGTPIVPAAALSIHSALAIFG
ncbi:hypothetical protein VE04_08416 [Pseudogymnoascus sp. 24MN13]|nr:hypothetical protein VE04_08416 [Pseudogymnoascus sp. 24MN13]